VAGIGVGDPAPDFTLPGTGGRDWSLAEFRGRPVVLVFYPGDGTPVCTEQLREYNAGLQQLDGLGAQVLALSPQDVDSHERFRAEHGFQFPLLADTDKAVGQAYGIIGPLGFYRRSIFVVNAASIVVYIHRSITNATFQHLDRLVEAIKAAS